MEEGQSGAQLVGDCWVRTDGCLARRRISIDGLARRVELRKKGLHHRRREVQSIAEAARECLDGASRGLYLNCAGECGNSVVAIGWVFFGGGSFGKE